MSYQIDQSGKIEQTSINTIIALINSKRFSIVLKKKDKRILEKVSRKMGKTKSYPYIVFAALLAIVLNLGAIKNRVVVDREYMEHENTIRERTLHFLQSLGSKSEVTIDFGHVGKLSEGHNLAAMVDSKKVKPDKTIALEEILELILEIKPLKTTEVEKRLEDT